MPNFTDRIIQGAGSRGVIGSYLSESLPNIVGDFKAWNDSSSTKTDFGAIAGKVSGVFSSTTGYRSLAVKPIDITPDNAASCTSVAFNANKSNAVYKDKAYVQQSALCMNIIIKY